MNLTGHKLDTPVVPGSPEWFASMSASKVAVACDRSNPAWGNNRYTLWHEMNMQRHLEKPNASMGRGHEFEPLIRGWFARDHKAADVRETSTWVHDIRDWQTADPDAEVWIDGELELLEVKTDKDCYLWERNGIPDWYLVQALWQMDTTGARRVHFAVAGPFEMFDRKPKYFTLDYDAREAAMIREKALRFMQSLELGVEPDRESATERDILALRWQQPTVNTERPPLQLPDDIAIPWLEMRANKAAREAADREINAQALEYLGDAKSAEWNGTILFTRKNGKPPSLVAANGIADRAHELLNPERKTA